MLNMDNHKNTINKKLFLPVFILPLINFIFNIFKHSHEGLTPQIISFEIIVLLYFYIIASFMFFLFIKNTTWHKYGSFYIFIIALLTLLFFIPFGLDLTDEGEQMSTAWFIFHGNLSHQYNYFKIGSWLANGVWLSLVNAPFLLWARFGGVIIVSLMVFTIYKTITLVYDDLKIVIPAVLISFIFVISHNNPETRIDHSNLPALLLFAGFYFYTKYTLKSNSKNNGLLLTASSSFIILSVVTRLPHIIFLIFPIIHFSIDLFTKKITTKEWTKRLFFYYGIPLVMALLCLLLIFITSTERLKSYAGSVASLFSGNFFAFDPGKITWSKFMDSNAMYKQNYLIFLMSKYTLGTIRIFIYIPLLTILTVGFVLFDRVIKKNKRYNLLHNASSVILIIIFAALFMIKGWSWFALPLAFFTIFPLYLILTQKSGKNELYFYIWGWIIFYTTFIGSNTAHQLGIHSGGIFILCSITIIMGFTSKEFLSNKNLRGIYTIFIVFLITLSVNSCYKKLFSNGRRDSNITKLDTMYKTPSLWGIMGSKQRVKTIDTIIQKIDLLVEKKSSVAIWGSVPLLHYLMDRDYFWNSPWTEQLHLSGLIQSVNQHGDPHYIIFGKKSAREENWPDTKVLFDPKDTEGYHALREYILIKQYANIYEDDDFTIYKLPSVK